MVDKQYNILLKIKENLTFELFTEEQFHTLFQDEYADIYYLMEDAGYMSSSGEAGSRSFYVTDKGRVEFFDEDKNRQQRRKEERRSKWGIALAIIGIIVSIAMGVLSLAV